MSEPPSVRQVASTSFARRGKAWRDGLDTVVVEAPLEVRVAGRPWLVTMRTPGEDADLVVGLLHCEGVLESVAELVDLQLTQREGATRCEVWLEEAALDRWARRRIERETTMVAACGVCSKSSVEDLGLDRPLALGAGRSAAARRLDEAYVCGLPQRMARKQERFAATGGLHAAALFERDGQLLEVREDVGRHNALDKVIGAWMRRDESGRGVDGRHRLWGKVLVTSGRAGFELVHKALCAQADALVAVGAASSLAIDLAERFGLGLYWFVKPDGGRRLPVAPQATPSGD